MFTMFLIDTRTPADFYWQHDSQPTLGIRLLFSYTGFATPHSSIDKDLKLFLVTTSSPRLLQVA